VHAWDELFGTVASCVKKVSGAGSCNFLTDSCKFLTEEIIVAHNFNFAHKFPQNGGFSGPYFAFLDESFRTRRRFSDSIPTAQNVRGAFSLYHDVTDWGGVEA